MLNIYYVFHKKNYVTLSNYNRANDACVCVRLSACVCKLTPITADFTVTKIAGYVRVRIGLLMNG